MYPYHVYVIALSSLHVTPFPQSVLNMTLDYYVGT